MPPIALTAVLVVSFLFPSGAAQEPPKKLEEPFRVFVFHPPAPGFEKEADRAAETVADQIKKRKDWLRVVDERDDAEILVEVYSQGIGRPGSKSTISGQGVTVLTPSTTGGGLGVRETAIGVEEMANLAPNVPEGHHFFETEVSFRATDSKVVMIGTASPNRRPSSAAADLAKKIESFCREHYDKLSEGR